MIKPWASVKKEVSVLTNQEEVSNCMQRCRKLMQNYVESFVKFCRKAKEFYRQNFVETLQTRICKQETSNLIKEDY